MIYTARLTIGSILLVATLACSEAPEQALAQEEAEPTQEQDFARLAAIKKKTEELLGEPRCSKSSECAAVAFGSKPCGGPWTYLVYSRMSVDEDALLEIVKEYNQFNRDVNERHGLISDCMLVTEPRLDCVNGVCVVPDKSP